MKAFRTLDAAAMPLDLSNVDTDQIIPARFLSKKRAEGYPRYCFHDLRFDAAGAPRPDFPYNRPEFRQAKILVAADNFGCGSSRESAVWALADERDDIEPSGFRAIVAVSFGDIFYNNSVKNGLLPVRLTREQCATLRGEVERSPGAHVTIDLGAQRVVFPSGAEAGFQIDEFRKTCLWNGVDDIGLTERHRAEVDAFVAAYRARFPWSVSSSRT